MKNQIKYVLQGVMFVMIAIFFFLFVKSILSVRISEVSSTQIDIDEMKPIVLPSSVKGQKLFSENCSSCHALNKRLTGPALRDFEKRGPWKDRKQVYAWIRHPDAYIKHDKYTKNLYKEYQVLMTPFPRLSNKDIDAIIEYIQSPIRMAY